MTDKTGGAAFPASGHPDMQFVAQEGMTLRDYLAAEAMNGILSNHKCNPMVTLSFNPDSLSRMAYEIADAMLKARG
ncbi:hypothetical protein ABN335_20945 [Providencia rettgeri]